MIKYLSGLNGTLDKIEKANNMLILIGVSLLQLSTKNRIRLMGLYASFLKRGSKLIQVPSLILEIRRADSLCC